jgi:hypothetical protein
MTTGRARQSRGPWLWPLLLVGVGLILLLDNFLLIEGFNPLLLSPLLLVLIGVQVLLKGDFTLSNEAKTFGITRGSVESAVLEVSAGSIDVQMRALQREGRLIAGQFAEQSRPQMTVNETRAHIRMDRGATPWYSLANWEMGLSSDLPWRIYVTTHLGQVVLDLSSVITEEATIATGFGDIRLITPYEAFGPIRLHSTLGNIQLVTPYGHQARINVKQSRMFNIHVDDTRYEQLEAGVYIAKDADPDSPFVEVSISGTFGNAYLA